MKFRRKQKQPGLAPGSLVHVGEQFSDQVVINHFRYDKKKLDERPGTNIEQVKQVRQQPGVHWVEIVGLHDARAIEEIGKLYDIHTLVLEDVMNSSQRPKFEEYDSALFIVVKILSLDKGEREFKKRQLALYVTGNTVISFIEEPSDIMNLLINRMRDERSRMRQQGSDYLAYRILDAVIDHYHHLLEQYVIQIDGLEEDLTEDTDRVTLQEIHHIRRQLLGLNKQIRPAREVVTNFQKSESQLLSETTELFLRDLHDHVVRIIETLENLRELGTTLLDIYLSSVSHRMNEVMKVLTVMASVFIPLTFLAGIYGMNFKYMPELDWRLAYPVFWLAITAIAITMLILFKRKKWL